MFHSSRKSPTKVSANAMDEMLAKSEKRANYIMGLHEQVKKKLEEEMQKNEKQQHEISDLKYELVKAQQQTKETLNQLELEKLKTEQLMEQMKNASDNCLCINCKQLVAGQKRMHKQLSRSLQSSDPPSERQTPPQSEERINNFLTENNSPNTTLNIAPSQEKGSSPDLTKKSGFQKEFFEQIGQNLKQSPDHQDLPHPIFSDRMRMDTSYNSSCSFRSEEDNSSIYSSQKAYNSNQFTISAKFQPDSRIDIIRAISHSIVAKNYDNSCHDNLNKLQTPPPSPEINLIPVKSVKHSFKKSASLVAEDENEQLKEDVEDQQIKQGEAKPKQILIFKLNQEDNSNEQFFEQKEEDKQNSLAFDSSASNQKNEKQFTDQSLQADSQQKVTAQQPENNSELIQKENSDEIQEKLKVLDLKFKRSSLRIPTLPAVQINFQRKSSKSFSIVKPNLDKRQNLEQQEQGNEPIPVMIVNRKSSINYAEKQLQNIDKGVCSAQQENKVIIMSQIPEENNTQQGGLSDSIIDPVQDSQPIFNENTKINLFEKFLIFGCEKQDMKEFDADPNCTQALIPGKIVYSYPSFKNQSEEQQQKCSYVFLNVLLKGVSQSNLRICIAEWDSPRKFQNYFFLSSFDRVIE